VNQIKSDEICRFVVICSAQHTEKKRPAVDYKNKIQENKTETSLELAMKGTTIQIVTTE